MPEGDSLARAERELSLVLAGRRLLRAQLRVPALATVDLTDRTVTRVHAYGKHLFMEIDGADVLHSHLMMEGRWRVLAPGERWPARSAAVRAVLETEDAQVLGIELGRLDAMTAGERDDLVASLGPDPIHAWDAGRALSLLRAGPERELGAALLDQRVVAGIGNIFRSESLFMARLSPFCLVGDLPDGALARVLDVAAEQLRVNAGRPARRTTPPTVRDRYWVYGRGGRPCPRGHGPVLRDELADPELQRDAVGGDPRNLTAVARDVFWCPRCQPGPAAQNIAPPPVVDPRRYGFEAEIRACGDQQQLGVGSPFTHSHRGRGRA